MQIDEDREDGPQLSKLASQYADLSAQVAELKQFIAPSPQQPCKPMRQQQQQQQQKPQEPKQPPPRQRQTELPHTASPQPAPRSSYASVAAAGSAATAAASATKPRVPRAPRSSPPCQERKAFIVQTPKGVLPSAGPLCQAVSVLLRDHIPELAQNYVYITDAVRVGDQSASSRVYITVKRLEYAETLVRFTSRTAASPCSTSSVRWSASFTNSSGRSSWRPVPEARRRSSNVPVSWWMVCGFSHLLADAGGPSPAAERLPPPLRRPGVGAG